MPKLTKTAVDAMPIPPKGDTSLWDSEVPGFGVRAQASGRKVYMVRYRTQDGTQRKQVIARTCDMAPEKARDLARKVFAQVAEGVDPKQEQRDAKAAPTLADLEERFMREHARPFKKAASVRADEANWRRHVLPILGSSTKVKAITKADALRMLGKLADKQATGNQCVALLGKAMNLAEDWGWREPNSNPCRRIKKFKIAEKELILAPAQIATLNATLTQMASAGRITAEFAAFIRLLMLTGCRKTEIMHAKRDWVDAERGLLLLPDSKVGQRRIPLSSLALEIVAELGDGGEWLIPGRRIGQPLQTPYKVWMAVKLAAGLPAELRLHDLRHTAGSLVHAAGGSQREVAEMLGHSQLSTTERYLHGQAGDGARVADLLAGLVSKAWSGSAAA